MMLILQWMVLDYSTISAWVKDHRMLWFYMHFTGWFHCVYFFSCVGSVHDVVFTNIYRNLQNVNVKVNVIPFFLCKLFVLYVYCIKEHRACVCVCLSILSIIFSKEMFFKFQVLDLLRIVCGSLLKSLSHFQKY